MRRTTVGRRVVRLALFSLATWGFVALGRGQRAPAGEPLRSGPAREPDVPARVPDAAAPSPRRGLALSRRMAASFAFAVLFFAGASFSAVAGDALVETVEQEVTTTDETTSSEEPAPESEPAPEPEPESEPEATGEPTPEPAPEETVQETTVTGETAPSEEPAPEPEPAVEPTPEPAPAPEPVVDEAAVVVAPEPAPAPAAEPAAEAAAPAQPEPAVTVAGDAEASADGPVRVLGAGTLRPLRPAKAPARTAARPRPVRPRSHGHDHLDPEVDAPATAATVWLARPLTDPTPPSLRLSPAVARRLAEAGKAHGVDWALVLGVLRADGVRRPLPARSPSIAEAAALLASSGAPALRSRTLSGRPGTVSQADRIAALERYYRQAWTAALAVSGRTTRADRAVALARYYRAVGLRALVKGLAAEQERLGERVLADPRVQMYAGGREDVLAGRIDVRVLALVAYLAEAHGQVTVSSLFSGHRLYSRPGVVSAHVYGQAVDIAALGGTPIAGNQQPGSVTERAVRDILLLPAEMLPRQVISLLGLGGPSFPLADHGDHIHVGY